jgi:hypothetical protein
MDFVDSANHSQACMQTPVLRDRTDHGELESIVTAEAPVPGEQHSVLVASGHHRLLLKGRTTEHCGREMLSVVEVDHSGHGHRVELGRTHSNRMRRPAPPIEFRRPR